MSSKIPQVPYATYVTLDEVLNLLEPSYWLNDRLVSLASFLLRRQFGGEGMRDTLVAGKGSVDYIEGDAVQILHLPPAHWIVGAKIEGKVKILDSYSTGENLPLPILTIVKNMFVAPSSRSFFPEKMITKPVVQQQTNSNDCGLFSIAFAECLLRGEDPSSVTFNIPKMRPHLYDCLFRFGFISRFPTIK
jgi:hypothetical protein